MDFSSLFRRVLQPVLLVLSRASYLLSSFALFLCLVRWMPLIELDRLSVGLGWLAVLVMAFDFGINEYMVRAVNSGGDRFADNLRMSMVAKLLLIFFVSLVYCVIVLVAYPGKGYYPVMFCTAGVAAARSLCDFAENALIARGRTQAVFNFAAVQAVAALAAGLLAARFVMTNAVSVLAAQGIVYAVLGCWRLHGLDVFRAGGDGLFALAGKAPTLILAAVPFGAMGLGAVLMTSAPLLIMSFETRLVGSLASFTAAQRIWSTLLSFGQGPFTRLYAVFSEREAAGDHEANQRLAWRMIFPLGSLGLGIVLGTVACGAPLLQWVYTSKLAAAYDDFVLLAASLPFALVGFIPGAWLPARRQERSKMSVVLAFCALLWILLLAARSHLNESAAAICFSVVWIVLSILFWVMASSASGLRTGWLRPNLLPAVGIVVLVVDREFGSPGKIGALLFGGLMLGLEAVAFRARLVAMASK